jgi:hypothetical protein
LIAITLATKISVTKRLICIRMIRILWIVERLDGSRERIETKNSRSLRNRVGSKEIAIVLRMREHLENIARVGTSSDERRRELFQTQRDPAAARCAGVSDQERVLVLFDHPTTMHRK